jgi:hypothetical protein
MDAYKVGFFVGLVLVIIIAAPLLLLWSLNTLFPVLAIPYTLETWLAALIIPAAFKSNIKLKG